MIIKKISAINFRNYSNLVLNLSTDKPLSVINAPNGMGKSNLLEMIYYLSYLRSFRNASDKELVKKGQKHFFIKSEFINNSISQTISVKYTSKKEILLNKKKVGKHSEILGKLLSVLFSNEDIFIINGAPSIRRRFFDIFISIFDTKYLSYLKKYQHILRQKNFILKQKNKNDLLNIYNTQIANLIVYIQKKRSEIITEINDLFQCSFEEIGLYKDKVKIIYSPSIKNFDDGPNSILRILEENEKKELELGYSILGPQRDGYLFIINGIPFSKYASFGQTRLAALVLKIVQTEYYKSIFNATPVLLLDDVILELDSEKQKRFINKILKYQQIFITVTNRNFLDFLGKKEYINNIEVINGKIG